MQDKEQDIEAVMGFSGFGKKTPMKFDVEKMFEQTRRSAKEYSQQVAAKKLEKAIGGEEDSDGDSGGDAGSGEGGGGGGSDVSSDDDIVGPPLPPGYKPSSLTGPSRGLSTTQTRDSDEDEEEGEEEQEFDKRYPISHEVTLTHGTKPVSALALDPSGARLVTGGYDYEVRFWDFAGMDSSLQSFRTIHPCESHQICSLQYSITGDSVLVAAGNAQAKLLDRDGHEKMVCPKGWQYIADMANTDGHIAMLHCACWHPKIKEHFLTCSNDGTLRIWDVNQSKKQLHVIKARDKQGRRTAVTTCAYTKDGKLIAGATIDGSIQLWKSEGPYVRSFIQQFGAHTHGTETSCLCFSHDSHTLVTRGGDDTLKLWDIRAFKRPVNVVTGLDNFYSGTDCVFSPDEQLIVTGVSVKKGKGSGSLVFFSRELKRVYQFAVSDTSVVRCLWHPKLNQIMVGCADGKAKVYFSPKHSFRGAKLCMMKQKRKKEPAEALLMNAMPIITPHALPMFRDDQSMSLKRKREKDRANPLMSRKPEPPVPGRGAGGRIGTGSSLGAYVRKITAIDKVEKGQDPREAVLKYAKVAAENPYWVSPAYHGTQPKPVFQEVEDSDEEDN